MSNQYTMGQDKLGRWHALVEGEPLCAVDALDLVRHAKNTLVTCGACLRELKARRRFLEASYPKCACGSTIGKDRCEAGHEDCQRCATRKAEVSEVEQLRARVAELEAELERLQDTQVAEQTRQLALANYAADSESF